MNGTILIPPFAPLWNRLHSSDKTGFYIVTRIPAAIAQSGFGFNRFFRRVKHPIIPRQDHSSYAKPVKDIICLSACSTGTRSAHTWCLTDWYYTVYTYWNTPHNVAHCIPIVAVLRTLPCHCASHNNTAGSYRLMVEEHPASSYHWLHPIHSNYQLDWDLIGSFTASLCSLLCKTFRDKIIPGNWKLGFAIDGDECDERCS